MDIQKLREQLYDKAEQEFNEFVDKLKQRSPDEILNSAYEKIMKEDILTCLHPEGESISDERVKALAKLEHPLSACYYEWMKTDYSYMDMLRDTVNELADKKIDEAKEEKAQKRKKSEPER